MATTSLPRPRAGAVAADAGAGLPDVSADQRVRASLEVLAGESSDVVAARYGVAAELVDRWVEQFVAAGSAAVSGRAPAGDNLPEHFLPVVAHEMRTPLAAVATALNLLTDPRLPQDRRAAVAGLVTGRLETLGRLCDDVLDGAGVALGQSRLSIAPLDLRALAAQVVRETDPDQLRLAAGPPVQLLGDRMRLHQVLSNVLRHAVRHGDGEVLVQVRRTAMDAVVTVSHHARERLSAEDATAWFEPFAGRSGRTGNGLALYVVRALTVAHGGTTGIDSTACDEGGSGQDLHVWIRLPLAGPVANGDAHD